MELIALQDACCADLLDDPMRFGAVARGYTGTPREATAEERGALRAAVAEGVRWLATNQPDRLSHKAWCRFSNEAKEAAERAISMVCGVGIIIAAILQWLISQGLTWLWNWWKRTRNAPQLVCGMIA